MFRLPHYIPTTLPRLLLLLPRHHSSSPSALQAPPFDAASPLLLACKSPTSRRRKSVLEPTQLDFILRKLDHNNAFEHQLITTDSQQICLDACWAKVQLLLEEGIAVSDVKKSLKEYPDVLFRTSNQQLASILRLLNSVGITGESLGEVLLQKPRLLRSDAENFEAKIKLFECLGVERKSFKALFKCFPLVLTLSETTLQERVQYLRDLGMSGEGIDKILCRCPLFFHLRLEDRVKPVVAYLVTCGLEGESLCRAIASRSDIFLYNHRSRSERIEFFRQLGLKEDSKSIARAFLILSNLRQVTLQTRVDFLKSREWSSNEIAQMVALFPQVLSLSEENLSKKLDYVVNVLKRDIKELVKYPMFFGYNLERRIMPRFDALAECKKQELHMIDYSFSTVLGNSEQVFQNFLLKIRSKS